MSLGLQATKRRINSVNSTKKITNAMKLVATSKLRSWKKRLSGNEDYANELKALTALLLENVTKEDKETIFGSTPLTDAKAYIVVTSTLGLCGGYNYNLYKLLTPLINKEKDILIVVGTKGTAYYKRNGFNVDDTYTNLMADFNLYSARKLKNKIVTLLKEGKVSEVKIAYTSYKNSITFIPTVDDVYPIKEIVGETQFSEKEKRMLIEPSPKEILESVVPLYLESYINQKLIESSVSEQASRSNAMETATDNATDIISKLQIQYNKARQQAITQEITEIVAGANAQ